MQGRVTVSIFGTWVGMFLAVTATAASSTANPCLPFFDFSKDQVVSNVVQPGGAFEVAEVDITPEPMTDGPFGEAVLKTCGEFGSRVNAQDVRKLIDSFNPDLIKELAREFPNFRDAQLRTALLKMWTSANGFEHVFCGQPKRDKLGGLHYSGRYYELQQKGLLCRLDDNLPNEEVLPQNVYTIGTLTSGGMIDRKKGFSIRQSAEDIFFEAARVYLRNCRAPSKERRVCTSRFFKDGSFDNRFVCAPNTGIITFYPLASTPKGSRQCR